jgi:arylformamidase
MKATFLSYFIEGTTPVYGGAKNTISIEKIKLIERGDTSNNLNLSFPNHIGTHIDFPYHFDNNGKKLDDYNADFWLFNRVGFLECSIDEVLGKLNQLPVDIELLILKTGFGTRRNEDIYWAEQPVIPAEFAGIFKQKFPKLRVFGFDLISLTSQLNKPEGKLAHLAFLCENDILIVEDMNLKHINTTPEKVIIAPLNVKYADGSPCTIIAYK